MALNLLSILSHCIRHTFKNISVLAGMNCCHINVLQELELFYCESLVQILFLNILLDQFVIDRFLFVIYCTEEHSWGKIILIVDDIHIIVTNIFFIGLFFLVISLQDDHFVTVRCLNRLLRRSLDSVFDSFFANGSFVNQVLFLLV